MEMMRASSREQPGGEGGSQGMVAHRVKEEQRYAFKDIPVCAHGDGKDLSLADVPRRVQGERVGHIVILLGGSQVKE